MSRHIPLSASHLAQAMCSAPTRTFNGRFRRELLPIPRDFFASEGIFLQREGPWDHGLCPFHDDCHPSLSVNLESGFSKCWSCGWQGGMVDFYMLRHGVNFVQAAKALGAWEVLS